MISNAKTKNVFLAVSADGGIYHCHSTSGRVLHSNATGNDIFCVDYSPNGLRFAAGTKGNVIDVYDETTK